jgi:hypothetical protein
VAIVDGIITLVQARASLNLGTGDTAKDSDIEFYVEAATPIIESIVGPVLAKTRTLVVDGGRYSIVLPYKIATVTTVVESGVATTDYTADLVAGIIYGGSETSPRCFAAGRQNIDLTVTVGSATIPKNVTLMARELVRHWWQTTRQTQRSSFQASAQEITLQPLPIGVSRRLQELAGATVNVPGFA